MSSSNPSARNFCGTLKSLVCRSKARGGGSMDIVLRILDGVHDTMNGWLPIELSNQVKTTR